VITLVPKSGNIVYYTGESGVINGVWQRNHIHGRKVAEIEVEITYSPQDLITPIYISHRKFIQFKLDNGDIFMEYERSNWSWFSGCWAEDPECCQQEYIKYIKPKQNDLTIQIESKNEKA